MEPSWNCQLSWNRRGTVVALLQAQLVRYLHEAGEPPASAVARAAVAAATAASAAASAASAAAGSTGDASAPLDSSGGAEQADGPSEVAGAEPEGAGASPPAPEPPANLSAFFREIVMGP